MMVNIGVWNIRGGHHVIKLDQCRDLICAHQLSIIAMLETKLNHDLTIKAANYIRPAWNYVHNLDEAEYGRILILYNPLHVHINPILSTPQMIHCHAKSVYDNTSFYITFVYALNSVSGRAKLFDIIPALRQNSHPWLLSGDFNCCYKLSDRDGGNPLSLNEINPLVSTLNLAEIIPVKTVGLQFTWNNKRRHGRRTFSRIDHSFSNLNALEKWPFLYCLLPPPLLSDHSPQIIHLRGADMRGKSSFKFFNSWIKDPDFNTIVSNAWNIGKYGNPLFILQEKIKEVKCILKQWSFKNFGKGDKLSMSIGQKLAEVQKEMMTNVDNEDLSAAEYTLNQQYSEALVNESDMIKQKSRIKWKEDGDRNSAFFHASLKNKQRRENITTILSKDDNLQTTVNDVQDAFVNYFSSIYGNECDFIPKLDEIPTDILPRLSEADYSFLCSEVTTEEIKDAMFSLNSNSCGGPDGLNAKFYTTCWSIVANDVFKAIKHFFKKAKLYRSFNYTNIALVPKVPNAHHVRDFRPISCCNTFYKCISKVIASRLKIVLPRVISKNQAAFLPGRNILDNILLAHELLKGYSRKTSIPKAMFKLDIMKAFDMLQWDSIIRIMGYMDFPPHFLAWIYECISTPTFSVIINGSPAGFFRCRQGIRQGDPISAYIFIVVMELLTRMIDSLISQGKFKCHHLCSQPSISTLMFADDLVVFCTPDNDTINNLMNVLSQFYEMTGLKINIHKSEIIVAGVNNDQLHVISQATGLYPNPNTVSYLGMPLITSRITTNLCLPLYERITARLYSWTTLKLSQAGRLTLVKSVIFAMQVYWARTYVLPMKLMKMIRSAFMRFLWTGRTAGKYIAPVNFKIVQLPLSKGGLGIINLKEWNKAAVAKHIDTYFNSYDSNWATWSRRNVIKGRSLWTMRMPQNLSWTWRSIFKLKGDILPLLQMSINNRFTVSFWNDPWLEKGLILKSRLAYNEMIQTGIHLEAKVIDVVHNIQSSAVFSSNQRIQQLWNQIKGNATLSTSNKQLVWGDKDASFTISKVYNFLTKNYQKTDWTWSKRTWHKDSSFRDNLLLWKVLHRAIHTKARLVCIGMDVDMQCVFCSDGVETVEHLFFECEFINHVWGNIKDKLRVNDPSTSNNNIAEWSSILGKTGHAHNHKRLYLVVLKCFISQVWNERNTRVFDAERAKSGPMFLLSVSYAIRSLLKTLSFAIEPGISLSF
jgi:hypothetical protein